MSEHLPPRQLIATCALLGLLNYPSETIPREHVKEIISWVLELLDLQEATSEAIKTLKSCGEPVICPGVTRDE